MDRKKVICQHLTSAVHVCDIKRRYPMLSIAAVNDAYTVTLTVDGFGAKFVKRSMFKVLHI